MPIIGALLWLTFSQHNTRPKIPRLGLGSRAGHREALPVRFLEIDICGYSLSRCGDGYCGLSDVDSEHPQQDDVQQSFFLAETLKYLYMIFCEDNVMSLDYWVFNTEAHAMPIVTAWE